MFTEQPIDPSSLLSQLVAGVDQRTKLPYQEGENKTWTRAVKETLKYIGERPPLNFTSLFTDKEKEEREFLLDFVWWDSREGQGAALAAECEWRFPPRVSPNDYKLLVAEDFDKLLVFKSPVKLMIFGSEPEHKDMQDSILDELRGYLRRYKDHIAGETYLFLDFAPKRGTWITRIDTSGAHPDVDITPVDFSDTR